MDAKAVMIIAPVDFRDEELKEPQAILEKAGVKVSIASARAGDCYGMLGGKVVASLDLKDIKAEEFQAIIFVGGSGASCFWSDPLAHKIIHDAMRFNRIIGAICIAPVTLANAGVLEGKRATVWKAEEAKITIRGALYTGRRVEYDGNIITANGPESAEQFGRSLVKELSKV